ncbi:ABC transporter permease [Spongiivirga citrea]|uniref:FtsX-like permease family protein n=1 Tax=Spongiivirga citrea TaxID=1481457 RepID=A0A6M0CNA8_9FLAO|nr:ABC transporter permease [Spongiivirga citrea]NER17339.1 FtsX-like permease family protein [Spongiivirga citrea]
MFKNHLKIAWRSFQYNKLFSTINILGLSLGLALTILLLLFINYERSHDLMYSKKDQLHRILLNVDDDGTKEIWCSSPSAVGPEMKDVIPGIKESTRLLQHDFGGTAAVNVNKQSYIESKLYWVDPSIVELFDVTITQGAKQNQLEKPKTVMISQSTANKYFGSSNPIGEVLTVDKEISLEITGVFEDFASNSSLQCDILGSFSSTWAANSLTWDNASFETYVLLDESSNAGEVETQMQLVLDKNIEKQDQWFSFSLQPLTDIHLYSSSYTDTYTNNIGNIAEVRSMLLLAILILVIACINYMNLTTAKTQKRNTDVGISKTLGATKKNLIIRFYTETALVTCIAIAIGLFMAMLLVPLFNQLTSNTLDINTALTVEFGLGLALVFFVTTLVSGSYPALFMAGFSPKNILSPTFNQNKNSIFVRKGLVVTQFVASSILIIGVLVIYMQLNYVKGKDLGFQPENVIAISTAGIGKAEKQNALQKELSRLSYVSSVSQAQGFPGVGVSGRSVFKSDSDEEGYNVRSNRTDASIINSLGLKLLAGKTLPENKNITDTIVDVVVNKKVVDYLGLTPEQAIGERINMMLGNNAYIVGVVDNFNFRSLREPIGGYAFHNRRTEYLSYLLVRYNSGSSNSLAGLERTYRKIAPDAVFDYSFVDNKVQQFYNKEAKTAQIGLIFCSLAIFIAALGLFGLAAFTIERRNKEIGIRKVLGASIPQIVTMISKDFVQLTLIALAIASPIAWFFMKRWLEGFAYKIDVPISVFVFTGLGAIVIALITVSFQSIKAAMTNPVNSLRTE